jgi:REP element-mobilizing transposase RayT
MATPPRRILPGAIHLVTRRCSERRYFLRPSKVTNEVVLYVLALAARRHGILVHAFCVLSNHIHLVVTDRKCNLPAFMQYLNSLVARALNTSLKRGENFWASDGSYSAVEPLAALDIVQKTAYVLANPVAAGLVRSGAEWPGLWTSPEQLAGGVKLVARKPSAFFDPKGYLPESVELELSPPRGFASAAEFGNLVREEFLHLEEHHRREASARRQRFLGAVRALAQNPFAHPQTYEPRFRLKPRVASRDPWRRIGALLELKTFLREYREAWLARRSGATNVIFPAGTYLLRVLHGVQCAGAA